MNLNSVNSNSTQIASSTVNTYSNVKSSAQTVNSSNSNDEVNKTTSKALSNSNISNIKSTTKIDSDGLITTYGKGENFTVTLKNINGTPIIGQHIAMNLTRLSSGANKIYWATTDLEGNANLQINLAPGNYSLTYSYYELSGTSSIKVKTPITLTGDNLTATEKDGSVYTVTLKDFKGNALVDKIVNITLSKGERSKTYQVLTDINGVASLAINLVAGNYNLTYAFNSDNYGSAISSSTLTINPTTSTNTTNSSTVDNVSKDNKSSSSSDVPTITIKAKPSVGHSGYSYKWYITTFVNYCPLCHHYNTLTINPKGVYESELTCSYCDADYDGVTGREKAISPRAYLTTVTAPKLA
jgi:hypothetical protein